MMALDPECDTLEQEFRRLEREVRQRECEHELRYEVTEMGDRERQFNCAQCHKRLKPEPLFDPLAQKGSRSKSHALDS